MCLQLSLTARDKLHPMVARPSLQTLGLTNFTCRLAAWRSTALHLIRPPKERGRLKEYISSSFEDNVNSTHRTVISPPETTEPTLSLSLRNRPADGRTGGRQGFRPMSPFSCGLGTQSLKNPFSSLGLSTLRKSTKQYLVVLLKAPYHFRKANRKTLNMTSLLLLHRFPPTSLGEKRCATGLYEIRSRSRWSVVRRWDAVATCGTYEAQERSPDQTRAELNVSKWVLRHAPRK
ncbi:uncharacterized protein LY79DRAFT_290721 [Colletotrichum navitas]|uniref:Uncharacterized protein n=1 Tax=Colletotrichum navitas TaxID=681940 RepID=A0AAD8PV82_9PEZI|nr:uncharacterized protein LY79DRAFT_290721 [Colletotrichum navitas]KAK1584851.1 hypothetical protein LY79DRAFT_290721 [Colletotrichum navitas]